MQRQWEGGDFTWLRSEIEEKRDEFASKWSHELQMRSIRFAPLSPVSSLFQKEVQWNYTNRNDRFCPLNMQIPSYDVAIAMSLPRRPVLQAHDESNYLILGRWDQWSFHMDREYSRLIMQILKCLWMLYLHYFLNLLSFNFSAICATPTQYSIGTSRFGSKYDHCSHCKARE